MSKRVIKPFSILKMWPTIWSTTPLPEVAHCLVDLDDGLAIRAG
jgi:hypothetical protein